MENKYHPSSDPIRAAEIALLIKALDTFLILRKETIADNVHAFFRPFHLEGLQVFADVAAKALKIFATEKKIRNSFRHKSDNDYFILCALLNNVVRFCNDIAGIEANIARMEKSKWELGDTSHISIRTIRYNRKKYENEVMNIRELMLSSTRIKN